MRLMQYRGLWKHRGLTRSACWLTGLFMLVSAHAATYHVAVDGDDEDDGLTEATAWATLQHAAEQVQGGDTVLVHAGTYTGFQIEQPRRGGTEEEPIVFKAASAEVILNRVNPVRGRHIINVEGADFVVIEGFHVRDAAVAGIRVVEAEGVVVKDNVVGPNGRWGIFTGFALHVQILNNETFASAEEHGIYVSNSRDPDDNPIIRGNSSYSNAGNGLQLNGDCHAGGDGTLEGAHIADNVVYDNGLKALSIISAPGARIENNVMYQNGPAAGGVHLVDEPGCNKPTTGAIVVNNTIDEPRMAGIRMTDGATANVIFNNLIVQSPAPIRDEVGGNLIGSNYMAAAPAGVFEDWAAGDYHLAVGSPAIDVGNATFAGAAAPALDADGVRRPQGSAYDAGAYERAGMPSAR